MLRHFTTQCVGYVLSWTGNRVLEIFSVAYSSHDCKLLYFHSLSAFCACIYLKCCNVVLGKVLTDQTLSFLSTCSLFSIWSFDQSQLEVEISYRPRSQSWLWISFPLQLTGVWVLRLCLQLLSQRELVFKDAESPSACSPSQELFVAHVHLIARSSCEQLVENTWSWKEWARICVLVWTVRRKETAYSSWNLIHLWEGLVVLRVSEQLLLNRLDCL